MRTRTSVATTPKIQVRRVLSMCFFERISIIFLMIFSGDIVTAGVYRCVDQFGTLEFSDRPCLNHSKSQAFLPYVYQRTNKKKNLNEERENKKIIKQIAVSERQRVHTHTRLQKQIKKETLKKQRFKERCVKTQEKIQNIESQLRLGCKLRRCQRLKRDLNHSILMKDRYCDTG
jgi:hypothetical protein